MPAKNFTRFSLCAAFIFSINIFAVAQTNTGMATGNYAGISGVWMNPASIVDSRYKFDINLIGLNSYYTNNYLLVKNTAIVRRLLYKAPYNSSYTDVKNDLLEEGTVNGKVYARTENNIQFPLSFMVTTGKKSAIAITMTNRTVNQFDSMNPLTAKFFFNELRYPELYNQNMNNDSIRYNFLNWQEVGFTYGRVLIGKGNIFLKAAVTAKWLGAGAAGFMSADKLDVSFKDSNTLSLNSPLIKYGRTASADFGAFQRKNIFNNIEDQTLGFDAGIVFELRGRLNKLKYVDEDNITQMRRDENKYLFRLGLSLVDVGEFKFKRRPLTNDHSANFTNWNFADVKANGFNDFDSAYAEQVNYTEDAPTEFTYRLPGAVIVNFDVHLLQGFYVNIAAKQPLQDYGNKATTYLRSDRWTVITPRFESRLLGIYVPITRAYNRTYIGATIKFGPFYAGSNNLAEILSNKKTYEADFHAGIRLSILQGKPSKFLLNVKRLIAQNDNDVQYKSSTQTKIDSLAKEVAVLKAKLPDSSNRPVVNVIIQNNGGQVQSGVTKPSADSIIISNKPANISSRSLTQPVQDTAYEFLLRQIAANNVEIKRLREDQNAPTVKGKKKKAGTTDTKDIEKELARLRAQMAVQNAALITATTVAANSGKNKNDTVYVQADSLSKELADTSHKGDIKEIIEDSATGKFIIIYHEPKNEPVAKTDTLYIRDTLLMQHEVASGLPKYQPIYFATNQTALTDEDIAAIKLVAVDLINHESWKIELTGRTDASGSAAVNQRVANARINAVRNALIKQGVDTNRILSAIALGNSTEKNSANQRRVDLLIVEQ